MLGKLKYYRAATEHHIRPHYHTMPSKATAKKQPTPPKKTTRPRSGSKPRSGSGSGSKSKSRSGSGSVVNYLPVSLQSLSTKVTDKLAAKLTAKQRRQLAASTTAAATLMTGAALRQFHKRKLKEAVAKVAADYEREQYAELQKAPKVAPHEVHLFKVTATPVRSLAISVSLGLDTSGNISQFIITTNPLKAPLVIEWMWIQGVQDAQIDVGYKLEIQASRNPLKTCAMTEQTVNLKRKTADNDSASGTLTVYLDPLSLIIPKVQDPLVGRNWINEQTISSTDKKFAMSIRFSAMSRVSGGDIDITYPAVFFITSMQCLAKTTLQECVAPSVSSAKVVSFSIQRNPNTIEWFASRRALQTRFDIMNFNFNAQIPNFARKDDDDDADNPMPTQTWTEWAMGWAKDAATLAAEAAVKYWENRLGVFPTKLDVELCTREKFINGQCTA
jgi:hypothetical protein